MDDWRTETEIEHLREQNRRLADGQEKLNRLIDELSGIQRRLADFLDTHPGSNPSRSVVRFPHCRVGRHDKKGAA